MSYQWLFQQAILPAVSARSLVKQFKRSPGIYRQVYRVEYDKSVWTLGFERKFPYEIDFVPVTCRDDRTLLSEDWSHIPYRPFPIGQ
jgi:hypothetical protein